jgi:hypothetical protein
MFLPGATAANMAILYEVEKLVISMKAKRHEVIVCGDLNFIRDNFLDADGGSPEIYKEQLEWIDRMAKTVVCLMPCALCAQMRGCIRVQDQLIRFNGE